MEETKPKPRIVYKQRVANSLSYHQLKEKYKDYGSTKEVNTVLPTK